jgi:hypothetical protein
MMSLNVIVMKLLVNFSSKISTSIEKFTFNSYLFRVKIGAPKFLNLELRGMSYPTDSQRSGIAPSS